MMARKAACPLPFASFPKMPFSVVCRGPSSGWTAFKPLLFLPTTEIPNAFVSAVSQQQFLITLQFCFSSGIFSIFDRQNVNLFGALKRSGEHKKSHIFIFSEL
jgi:hypothetical protein